MYNPTSHTRQQWGYPKDEEKNVVASFFHFLTILLICTSLVNLNWFRIWGGHCAPHLGTYQFFGFGEFYATTHNKYHVMSGEIITSPSGYVIHYNTSSESLACVTPDIANLMHIMIILSILAIFSSSVGLCLDMIGPTKSSLKILRRNAVPSIATVLIVITIIGTSYFVTRSLEESLMQITIQTDMEITYDYGCYVITAAGSFSILATACNLLQLQSGSGGGDGGPRHSRLLEDWDGLETFSHRPLPPPPYTP